MMRVSVDDAVSCQGALSVWQVYESVFGDYVGYDAWVEGMWGPHRSRDGFRLARAFDGDDLVGFAWGYNGARGQWWTDQALTVLDAEVADVWLGGHFELVTIGVVVEERGSGTGRGLLRALLDGLSHDRFLLMTTADESDPAHRLYASEGWLTIGRGLRDATVIMGRYNRVRHPATTRPGPRST